MVLFPSSLLVECARFLPKPKFVVLTTFLPLPDMCLILYINRAIS